MESAISVFRLLAASQVLLFTLLFAVSPNPIKIRLTGGLLLLGVICYLVAPMVVFEFGREVGLPAVFLATIVPFTLLLFIWPLFEESEAAPVWLSGYVLACVVTTLFALTLRTEHVSEHHLSIFLQILKLVALVMAVFIIWRGRDADLVALRLKVRDFLVASILVIALGIVMVELITAFIVPEAIEMVGMAIIFCSTLIHNFVFLRLNPRLKLVQSASPPIDQTPDKLIETLLQRMTNERLYADHDLRVAGLANTLRVPEYQLRKRINQHLGYRNFNQFINHYRIKEAAARLLTEPTLPVLSIALDVGFRSISSFNTAFLKEFGMAPTQYRAQSH